MRSRLLLVFAFAVTAVGVSCSGSDEAPARAAKSAETAPVAAQATAVAVPPRKAVSPAVVVAAASDVATTPALMKQTALETATAAIATPTPDPATLTVLPPELVDDGSDDMPYPDPSPVDLDRREVDELASTAKETWVFAEPSWKGRRIGLLRAGAIVQRRAQPAAKTSTCHDGWYRVEPKGFVCVGATATLNVSDPVVEASARRPKRDGLPYTYVMSRSPSPPFYARLPTAEEALRVEPDLQSHLRKTGKMTRDPSYVPFPNAEPVPGALLYGRGVPGLANTSRSPDTLELGRAKARSAFALLSTFDYEGRRYGLTTELAVLPLDRTRVIKPSAFAGITLGDEVTLPVAFVRSRHAFRHHVGPGASVARGERLAFRQAVALTGTERRIGGQTYLEAKDGFLLLADQAVRVDPVRSAPAWAAGHRKWIDVSILKQSLVAYEGNKPVYVTLVSTGADGLGDPKKTHSTIQGAFLIHTKHLSVTMDDDTEGDEFDFRDVPFVQYFTEGFALHAAFWHDDFGTPRSHGCVNLAPTDAARLFNWTDPDVPPAWHGALSVKKGTLVYIHP